MRHNLIDAITVYHKRGKMNCFKLFCGITLCIFGTLLYSAHAAKGKKKKQDPVDFTVVKDSTMKKAPKSRDGLPRNVGINFDVLGNPVKLNLIRNPKVEKAKGVYVIRKSDQGIPVVVEEKLSSKEVAGEYQDMDHNAIFTVSCDTKTNLTKCDPIMEGSFVSKGVEYSMELLDERSNARVRRDVTSKLWGLAKNVVSGANEFSKVYGIFKTEKKAGTPSDFKEESAPINAAFTRELKTVRENVLPGGKQHNVEVLVVADYSIYERFYKASKAGTRMEKDQDAKRRLKKYFSHVLNGVDMLYRGIEDQSVGISVALAGFAIADSPETSDWTTPFRDIVRGDERDEVYVNNALEELVRWAYRARNLPDRDHIMLFTDYDLYSTNQGRKDDKTAGFARVGAMCDLDSASVVEDHGGFQSINTAAHELGHSLGSHHDGFNNQCSGYDQYIMTARGGITGDATNPGNPWKFSTCSVNYFRNFLQRLPWQSCLSDPVDLFDRDAFLEFMSTYPGQDQTPNQQCQDILGLDSFYGWGSNLGTFSDICTEMSCFVPGRSSTYRVYKAATGTSCGDKKWCIKGKCVFSEKAPSKSPSCIHGDSQRRFNGGQSCIERLLDFPGRCYDPFYKVRCCDTCPKLHTGVQGCEYGDKFRDCNRGFCGSPSYARDCCSTCGIAPHPVIKAVTTTTVRPPPRVITTPAWRRTTRRPPMTTRRIIRPRPPPPRRTTPRTPVVPTPDNRIIPSGKSGMCIQKDKNFLIVFSCSSLTSMFGQDACDNSLIRRYCCEPCPQPGVKGKSRSETSKCVKISNNNGVSIVCTGLGSHFKSVTKRRPLQPKPVFQRCVDEPDCDVKYGRDCYFKSKRDKCCRTCKRFQVNAQAGCEYGDRIQSCQRFLGGLGRTYVCAKYAKYCCGSCGISAASTQNQGVVISDSAVETNISQGKKGRKGPKGKKKKGPGKGKKVKKERRKQKKGHKKAKIEITVEETTIKQPKKNELMDLFNKAVQSLNSFFN